MWIACTGVLLSEVTLHHASELWKVAGSLGVIPNFLLPPVCSKWKEVGSTMIFSSFLSSEQAVIGNRTRLVNKVFLKICVMVSVKFRFNNFGVFIFRR